jgi:hypothetical protein
VEAGNLRRKFKITDEYLSRWNTDNEPHRSLWTQAVF